MPKTQVTKYSTHCLWCNEKHMNLKFKRLAKFKLTTEGTEGTYQATCPETKKPILLNIDDNHK